MRRGDLVVGVAAGPHKKEVATPGNGRCGIIIGGRNKCLMALQPMWISWTVVVYHSAPANELT